MAAQVRAMWSAYTYAWWLTGDERAAEQALRAATDAAERNGDGLAGLMRAVRTAAIDTPTMCPASELALLHDTHCVSLESAADIAEIDPADATVELAHGRLEALTETVGDITHPERLGGLAVGNPGDVAHARQCADCGRVRTLLGEGRSELRRLPTMQPPDALMDDIDARERASGVAPEEEPTAGAWRRRATAVVVGAALVLLLLVATLSRSF